MHFLVSLVLSLNADCRCLQVRGSRVHGVDVRRFPHLCQRKTCAAVLSCVSPTVVRDEEMPHCFYTLCAYSPRRSGLDFDFCLELMQMVPWSTSVVVLFVLYYDTTGGVLLPSTRNVPSTRNCAFVFAACMDFYPITPGCYRYVLPGRSKPSSRRASTISHQARANPDNPCDPRFAAALDQQGVLLSGLQVTLHRYAHLLRGEWSFARVLASARTCLAHPSHEGGFIC